MQGTGLKDPQPEAGTKTKTKTETETRTESPVTYKGYNETTVLSKNLVTNETDLLLYHLD